MRCALFLLLSALSLWAQSPRSTLVLYLKPAPAQKRDLKKLLSNQQNPNSPDYHRWLTPEQFADRFGANPSTVQKLSGWLEAHGFSIGHVSRGRRWIVFQGDEANVSKTFGKTVVPPELSELVSGIGGLRHLIPSSDAHVVSPAATLANGFHALVPGDYATIFDIAPLYKSGIDGTGQKIVIVGQSSVDLSDIQTFRSRYGLPSQTPQIVRVPTFPDPGLVPRSASEADLDLEWSGAVARNASLIFVYSFSAFDAAAYAIDQNLAPIVSSSFSLCEAFVGSGELANYRLLAQQAVAQGITWLNSSGDAGAAGCDPNEAAFAQNGFAVRFPSSIPEVTGVGGTELNDTAGNYWSTANSSDGWSALSYIPEIAWNDVALLKALNAGGGGPSIFFPKPAWQIAGGVPADGFRDVPDVSLPASAHVPYTVVSQGKTLYFYGTSASTPSFAGMLALLNQYLVVNGIQKQPGLGNLNAQLYPLSQASPSAFHDITSGNNAVPCAAGSPDCSAGSFGRAAGPGYDLVTGLGSPDLNQLVHAWSTKASTASLIDISLNENPVSQQQPNADGYSWVERFTLTEEAGIPTTLTDFTIDGASLASQIPMYFGGASIPAHGSISTQVGFKDLTPPFTEIFGFSGRDASGQTWTRQIAVPFVGFPPVPSIGGSANGASFQTAFAPGMVLSVFGAELALGAQEAETVPLINLLQNFSATIGGAVAPIYYVSPGQVNVQIPYGTPPGAAQLVVFNGDQLATSTLQIAESAPGIFAGPDGSVVPSGSGKAGDPLVLFITGEGEVTPALATGSAPSTNTPIASLPQPVLPVTVTIGGMNAPVAFVGIPYGLVGVTQINTTVPAGLTPGKQPVVVKVGNASSMPVNFTVE